MKKALINVLECERCGYNPFQHKGQALICPKCDQKVSIYGDIPLFTSIPQNMHPSHKVLRGPDKGTPWRQANWQFLKEQLSFRDYDALILDVGAGRGDFSTALEKRPFISLDIYPYPEVDIVCDLTKTNPFQPNSFETVLLFNVLEHIYDTNKLMQSLTTILKPDGSLLVAIPFMIKIHQEPVDFVRYTHFALEKLGAPHNLKVEYIEGYYDPISLLHEGISNLKYRILPTFQGYRYYGGRILLEFIKILTKMMHNVTGSGWTKPPSKTTSLSPTGYHVVYRKIDTK